jgi:hypothetical protein
MQESIGEVMPLQTLGVLGATSKPLMSRALSQESAPLNLAYLLPHTSTPTPSWNQKPYNVIQQSTQTKQLPPNMKSLQPTIQSIV